MFECLLPFLSGPIGSSSLTSAYVPSFLKKEVGSAGQRVQLAPVVDPSSGKSSTKVLLVPWSVLQQGCMYAALNYLSLLHFIYQYMTDWNYCL